MTLVRSNPRKDWRRDPYWDHQNEWLLAMRPSRPAYLILWFSVEIVS